MREARALVVLTGAGISAESGVPVFRGHTGLWRDYRPEDLATPAAFARQPEVVWDWYLWRRSQISAAMPNAGHDMLARLQRARPGVTLLTQNVDGLHQRAGSLSVAELHGSLWRVRCAHGCGFATDDAGNERLRNQTRCRCGAWLRPSVVWFGESLDPDVLTTATHAIREADLVLVVGTSAAVYPVAALPELVQQHGGRLVEINVEDTPLSVRADAVLRGAAGRLLPALERAACET